MLLRLTRSVLHPMGVSSVAVCGALLLAGCGGDDGVSEAAAGEEVAAVAAGGSATPPPVALEPELPGRAAQLPDHDPEARYAGRTALEYAADLRDLSPQVQSRALQSLRHFGVNGLPARDEVRRVIDSDAQDGVKLLALEVLITMQAPEAPALIRQKLTDPQFLAEEGSYQGLILLAQNTSGIGEADLREDMARLAGANPAHAAVLMTSERLNEPVQQALIKALLPVEHDARATAFFLPRLTTFDFLEDEARIAYVRRHLEAARHYQVHNATLRMLHEIGTEEAMRAAIELGDHGTEAAAANARRMQLMSFASRNVDPVIIVEMFMDDIRSVRGSQEVQRVLPMVATVPRSLEESRVHAKGIELNQQRQRGELEITPSEILERVTEYRTSGSAEIVAAREAVIAGLREMIFEGPTEDHQAYAAAVLWRFARDNPYMPLFPALDPLFEAMMTPDLPGTVHATVWDGMNPQFSHRDGETYARRFVELMWKSPWLEMDKLIAESHPHTGFWGTPVTNRLQGHAIDRHFAPHLIRAIAESYEEHRESEQINLAILVLNHACTHSIGRGDRDPLRHTPERSLGAIMIGRMLASPGASYEHLAATAPQARQRDALMPIWDIVRVHVNPGAYTVDGVIGVLEPIVFATSPTPLHVAMDQVPSDRIRSMESAFNQAYLARRHTWPEGVPAWKAFIERMAAESPDPRFRQLGQACLESMERWR